MPHPLLLLLLLASLTHSLGQTSGKPDSEQLKTDTITCFTLPNIPSTLRTPNARAEYLIAHYWDNVNFADAHYAHHKPLMEQAWVNYIDLLPYLTPTKATEALKNLFRQASASQECFLLMASLAEKYLYETNSPMRNEEYYLPVLEALITSPHLTDAEKIRPHARKELALKNRIGTQATDFTYTLPTGETGTLHTLEAPYILLYFNNPDCHTCHEVSRKLQQSTLIRQLSTNGLLKILSFYPDDNHPIRTQQLYDLKRFPTLYLLNSTKLILLKDATPEQIEKRLERIKNEE
ncbi:MAG: DUF5106 domain-containing protein [Bacteroides sp.]|nr:DUF5106 domain-containing protein [Bacteroides sp.]